MPLYGAPYMHAEKSVTDGESEGERLHEGDGVTLPAIFHQLIFLKA